MFLFFLNIMPTEAVAYIGFHFGGGGVQNIVVKATHLLGGFGGMLSRENF